MERCCEIRSVLCGRPPPLALGFLLVGVLLAVLVAPLAVALLVGRSTAGSSAAGSRAAGSCTAGRSATGSSTADSTGGIATGNSTGGNSTVGRSTAGRSAALLYVTSVAAHLPLSCLETPECDALNVNLHQRKCIRRGCGPQNVTNPTRDDGQNWTGYVVPLGRGLGEIGI